MPVSAFALTSLANLKEYMGISTTANDTLLEKCIDRASVRMETYCGRKLKARDHAEWRDGCGVSEIRMNQYPVSQITNVWTGNYSALVVSSSDPTDVRASVSVNQETGTNAVVLTRTDATGSTTTTTLSLATYPTTAALATAIGSTAGYTCTLGKNLRSVQLRPRAGGDTVLATVTLFAADTASDYTYDHENGRLSIDQSWWAYWPMDNGKMPDAVKSVLVEYRAGYETIPGDMEECCIEVSAMIFRDRQRDKSLITERLGDYSYSRASQSGEVMGSSILAVMEEYLLEYRDFA